MITPLSRPATQEGLFLWVMHQFAARFDQRAILKGGLELRLLDSQRSTTAIDYVFAPLKSKKEAERMVTAALKDLIDAEIDIQAHSKMVRARVRVDGVGIQVEVNVSERCPTIAIATGDFARALGQPSRVITAMAPNFALADRLAAWNERRLAGDLYDCYFLRTLLGARVDLDRLDQRLARLESRIPRLRKRKMMTRKEFARELRSWADTMDGDAVLDELRPLLPLDDLPGLDLKIRAAVGRLADEVGE